MRTTSPPHAPEMRTISFVLAMTLCSGLLASCQTDQGSRNGSHSNPGREMAYGQYAELPEQPKASASSAFWDHWGDGKAELSGYRGEISRYDELRKATAVFIYVTEAHDRRTWVKDQSVDQPHRVDVLKLNRALKFQTGIYPYSVMTSVFSPVDDWGRPRFQPTKISLTSQEWCGNLFLGIWPGPEMFFEEMHSYFAEEEDRTRRVSTSPNTLYQDALPIQLRELDGPFNGGENWEGEIVPSAWHSRKSHEPLEPVDATIERQDAKLDGTSVTRFVLEYGDTTITYDIEKADPRRMLRWKHSNGGHLRLVKTTRLPYWKLHDLGDETYREQLGLGKRIRRGGPENRKESNAPNGGPAGTSTNADTTNPDAGTAPSE